MARLTRAVATLYGLETRIQGMTCCQGRIEVWYGGGMVGKSIRSLWECMHARMPIQYCLWLLLALVFMGVQNSGSLIVRICPISIPQRDGYVVSLVTVLILTITFLL